jgi:hypothetical protein
MISIRLYVFAHNNLRTTLALRTGLKLIYAFTCARVLMPAERTDATGSNTL